MVFVSFCSIFAAEIGKENLAYNRSELTDRVFVERLAKQMGYAKELPSSGTYEVAQSFDPDPLVILIYNGTELGRLNAVQSKELLTNYPGLFDNYNQGNQQTKNSVINKFDSGNKLLKLAQWTTGIDLEAKQDYMFSGTLVRRDNFNLSMLYGAGGFLFIGGGGGVNLYTGALAEKISEKFDLSTFGYNVSGKVGIPGVMVEIDYLQAPYGEYFWLERDLEQLWFHHDKGNYDPTFLNDKKFDTIEDEEREEDTGDGDPELIIFDGTLAEPDPLTIKIKTKLWYGHADVYLNGAYASPVIRLYFDEIPAIFGQWGMGFTYAGSNWVPGVWADILPWNFYNMEIGYDSYPLHWTPVSIYYHRIVKDQFLIGFKTKFTFGFASSKP